MQLFTSHSSEKNKVLEEPIRFIIFCSCSLSPHFLSFFSSHLVLYYLTLFLLFLYPITSFTVFIYLQYSFTFFPFLSFLPFLISINFSATFSHGFLGLPTSPFFLSAFFPGFFERLQLQCWNVCGIYCNQSNSATTATVAAALPTTQMPPGLTSVVFPTALCSLAHCVMKYLSAEVPTKSSLASQNSTFASEELIDSNFSTSSSFHCPVLCSTWKVKCT